MKRKPTLWLAALAVAFIVPLGITSASADVIMDWNAKADAIAAQKQLPAPPHSRGLAMMHVAMFEAVNAVERRYAPYKLNLPADRNSSKEAAAASAGYHVLVALYPDQKADLDAAFVAMLAGVAEGEPKAKGVEVGKKAAAGIIELRGGDGADAQENYRPHTSPGIYVPTVIPVFSTAGAWTPWSMTSGSQFRPAPPPALSSETWTRDLNEIRDLGRHNSTKRTAEQTTIGRFWFLTGARTYNPIVRQVAMAKDMDLVDCARLYALVAIAGADAYISVFDGKYAYNLWRPVTAIRNADQTNNPAARRHLDAARRYPDAPGISLCALHHVGCGCRGAARRRRRRGERNHPDQPDRTRDHSQVDAAEGLQRRGCPRPDLCWLPLPFFSGGWKRYGQEDRRAGDCE